MITIEEALDIVLKNVSCTGFEKINFTESLGRILAEDVKSDIEMPPFNKSAMDGYACKRADLENTLEIIEIIPAGKTPEKEIGKNQCANIMTGAPIPKGADCVVMVEHTEKTGDKHIKVTKINPKSNISLKGEDIKVGDKVLDMGTLIEPQHMAVFASVGYTSVLVYKKPKVGIISTGDELVEPYNVPSKSQIRNSNAYQLIGQVKKCGAIANYIGIAEDNYEDTYKKITQAIQQNDIIMLTGGVSMGTFDFVPKVLKDAGVKIEFDALAVKPGKPTTFGKAGETYCFGLPGNPVSSFMQFELLVKPLIFKLMKHDFKPLDIQLPMGVEYKRKKDDRKAYMPVVIQNAEVFPVDYHGSAHINALTLAHGIIAIELGAKEIKKGEKISVRQI